MAFDIGNLVQQVAGGLDNAPSGAVAQGLTEAFRSGQMPPFAQMVSQLFGRSDPDQRAGLLNQLLANVSPAMLISLAGSIGKFMQHGSQPQVTPQQAEQITPAQVEEIAATAEQHNPGIVELIGSFYAGHPELVKTLGDEALAIVSGKVRNSTM